LVLVFLLVVGITGYLSLNGTVRQMGAIAGQIEIAKKVNHATSFSQDGQAGSLRFVIYQDDSYMRASQEANNDAIKEIEEAKSLMESEENRRNADSVAASARACIAANTEYESLARDEVAAGKVRVEASAKVQESIKKLIARREQSLQERSQDSDKGKMTEYDGVQKTLMAQAARSRRRGSTM